MGTTIKIAFSEAQKWVTSQTAVESDEMSKEDVQRLAEEIAMKAMETSAMMTMRKQG